MQCTTNKRYYRYFFFNDTATTEIYTLSLHDALPICGLLWELYSNPDLSIAYAEIKEKSRIHKHQKMKEVYRIEKGKGRIFFNKIYGGMVLGKGEYVRIPDNTFHHIEQVGKKPLEVLVITHPRFDPSDIIEE